MKSHPHVKGILFDLPHVVSKSQLSSNFANRVQVVGGSFFDVATIPKGADAYIMKHIIHDWSDEKSVEILKNVRSCVGPHSKLLLTERICNFNDPLISFLDLQMFCLVDGKERTRGEFEELLSKAGFKLTEVHRSSENPSFTVIEAVPL